MFATDRVQEESRWSRHPGSYFGLVALTIVLIMQSSISVTLASALLTALAREHRRVISGWRTLVIVRRATFGIPAIERRWTALPREIAEVQPLLRQMQRRGEVAVLDRRQSLYKVTVPYADQGIIEENEALMEVHPYASVSHLSALVFHGLTEQLPKRLTALAPSDSRADLLPVGTRPEDWEGIPLATGRKAQAVLRIPVEWSTAQPSRYFGMREYAPRGYPVRVTTVERTLIDGLLKPELSGGFDNVLRAWMQAQDTLELDVLINMVERFDIQVLKQRAGFLLELFGNGDPRLESWQRQARRGGSSKLVAVAPYSPVYSERWSLSLNASLPALVPGA